MLFAHSCDNFQNREIVKIKSLINTTSEKLETITRTKNINSWKTKYYILQAKLLKNLFQLRNLTKFHKKNYIFAKYIKINRHLFVERTTNRLLIINGFNKYCNKKGTETKLEHNQNAKLQSDVEWKELSEHSSGSDYRLT